MYHSSVPRPAKFVPVWRLRNELGERVLGDLFTEQVRGMSYYFVVDRALEAHRRAEREHYAETHAVVEGHRLVRTETGWQWAA